MTDESRAKSGKRQHARRYTEADKVSGIHAYVWCGSALRAEEVTGYPHQRILEWVKADPERLESEREKMRQEYREKLYAARQAYLEHMLREVGNSRVSEATGALKELSRCIDALEGSPTERVEVTIEDRLRQIRKERGLEDEEQAGDDEGGDA